MGCRSAWKGPFFPLSLLHAIKADTAKAGIPTRARNSTIIPDFVGAQLMVHNGKDYIPLKIQAEMVGKKIREFVLSTKPKIFHKAPVVKKKKK